MLHTRLKTTTSTRRDISLRPTRFRVSNFRLTNCVASKKGKQLTTPKLRRVTRMPPDEWCLLTRQHIASGYLDTDFGDVALTLGTICTPVAHG